LGTDAMNVMSMDMVGKNSPSLDEPPKLPKNSC